MKVLIPTSGVGSRLGNLTKNINKALVKVGDKAAISHIIDSYPYCEFVVTLGYKGDLVKEYLEIAHPDREFIFVWVDNWDGPGSSLLKSISYAEPYLQEPFIFHVCDTISLDPILYNEADELICADSNKSDVFRSISCSVSKKYVHSIHEKGEINYDYIYTGIAIIKSYWLFWKELKEILNSNSSQDLSDCHVFQNIIPKLVAGVGVRATVINNWYDIGNVENLNEARKAIPPSFTVLNKRDENIYLVDNFIIKFFSDASICKNRITRSLNLKGIVPKIEQFSEHFYKYLYQEGELLSKNLTPARILELIHWADLNLWKPVKSKNFKETCLKFYKEKTAERICEYMTGYVDCEYIINGEMVPDIVTLFDSIDWGYLCNSDPTSYHGDFILDNILIKEGIFTLLDWRQDFGGELEAGDIYYDLAKLNHNLTLNHDIISKGLFTYSSNGRSIVCDILVKDSFVRCREAMFDLLGLKGYDIEKIKLLTPIIWLNMASLHQQPFSGFLFNYGKYNLWRELSKRK